MNNVKKLYSNSTGQTRPPNSTVTKGPHSRQFIYNKAAARAAKINQQTGGTEWQNR